MITVPRRCDCCMLSDFQLLKNKVQKVALQATRRKPVASTTEVMYNCAPKFHGSHYASEQHWSWNKTCQSGYLFYKCSCCHFFFVWLLFFHTECVWKEKGWASTRLDSQGYEGKWSFSKQKSIIMVGMLMEDGESGLDQIMYFTDRVLILTSHSYLASPLKTLKTNSLSHQP